MLPVRPRAEEEQSDRDRTPRRRVDSDGQDGDGHGLDNETTGSETELEPGLGVQWRVPYEPMSDDWAREMVAEERRRRGVEVDAEVPDAAEVPEGGEQYHHDNGPDDSAHEHEHEDVFEEAENRMYP